jgi:DNA-directed RNA polymerase beta' subunit
MLQHYVGTDTITTMITIESVNVATRKQIWTILCKWYFQHNSEDNETLAPLDESCTVQSLFKS